MASCSSHKTNRVQHREFNASTPHFQLARVRVKTKTGSLENTPQLFTAVPSSSKDASRRDQGDTPRSAALAPACAGKEGGVRVLILYSHEQHPQGSVFFEFHSARAVYHLSLTCPHLSVAQAGETRVELQEVPPWYSLALKGGLGVSFSLVLKFDCLVFVSQ